MAWDFAELRDRCANCGLGDPTDYQNALNGKMWRVRYFNQRSLEVWDELFASEQVIQSDSLPFQEAWLKAEWYAEAALQALHSMADVLAQLVNLTILGGRMAEDQVSLNRVQRELDRCADATYVKEATDSLLQSDSFRYTMAFTNTVKHRRLHDTAFYAASNPQNGYRRGLRFQAFTYRGDVYPAKTVQDIVEVVVPQVHEHIENVGNAVNDYLR
jgi:hypothetical protein